MRLLGGRDRVQSVVRQAVLYLTISHDLHVFAAADVVRQVAQFLPLVAKRPWTVDLTHHSISQLQGMTTKLLQRLRDRSSRM
jgi:hypothetical protein